MWIDEIEKGFASGASGSGDSGTSARVFGTFLSWMQEKTAAVFVIATANNISLLPPEMMRKGRFDEIFFIDLPTDVERRVIFSHPPQGPAQGRPGARRAGRSTTSCSISLCSATEGFSGAEIEQVVISACFDAFNERRRADRRRPAARDRQHRPAVGDAGRTDRRAAGLGRRPRGRRVRAGGPRPATPPRSPATSRRWCRRRPCWPGVAGPSRPEPAGLRADGRACRREASELAQRRRCRWTPIDADQMTRR